ncbi:MAG: hypothetical protein H0U73_13870 [Tatlockia sp.]|nr:hypothetical protein [Tatlockia sp.]
MQTETEIKILLKMDELLELFSDYYAIVKDVDSFIHNRFPYGAFNREDKAKNLDLSDEELKGYLAAMEAFKIEMDDEKIRDVARLANISQPLAFADNRLMTNYTLGYLKLKYPSVKIEGLYVGGYFLILIGRENYSDPENFSTWGNDAIICDFWAGRCDFADYFLQIEKTENIPFYTTFTDPYSCETTLSLYQMSHYLSGKPQVIEGATSSLYEQKLIKWVKEDQRRIHQPAPIPHSTIGIKPALNSVALKSALSTISKCSDWKYSQTQGFAWLECKNLMQAQRITKSLENTRSTVVNLMMKEKKTNTDPDIYFVKCTHINLPNLSKLAASLDVDLRSGCSKPYYL